MTVPGGFGITSIERSRRSSIPIVGCSVSPLRSSRVSGCFHSSPLLVSGRSFSVFMSATSMVLVDISSPAVTRGVSRNASFSSDESMLNKVSSESFGRVCEAGCEEDASCNVSSCIDNGLLFSCLGVCSGGGGDKCERFLGVVAIVAGARFVLVASFARSRSFENCEFFTSAGLFMFDSSCPSSRLGPNSIFDSTGCSIGGGGGGGGGCKRSAVVEFLVLSTPFDSIASSSSVLSL